MNRLTAVSLALASAVAAASAAPRVAMVDVKEIYEQLPSTATLREEISVRQNAILLDQRADQLRKALADLKLIESQLVDKANPLTLEEKQTLARSYELKRQEALTMQNAFEEFRKEQNTLINREMVAAMRASLDRIAEVSARIARDQNFDVLFDESGETNTGVPFVLYAKSSTDITPAVLAALVAPEPEPAEPPPAEETLPTNESTPDISQP